MMKKQTRRLSLLLLLSVCAAAAASCGGTAGTEEKTPSAADNADNTPEETEPAEPEIDYGGYKVNFLVTEDSWGWWHIGADEQTGDTLQDATWQRNRAVEEALNVAIVENSAWYSETPDMMRQSVMAADGMYDAVTIGADVITSVAKDGYLLDAYEMPGLHLDEKWWNARAINDLAVGNKAYMLIGDLHLMFYESHYGIMFNQELVQKYNLENPYDLVQSGKWTFDTMCTMAQAVSSDVNGDGSFLPSDDQFGICMCTNTPPSMLIALGARLTDRDASGMPVYEGVSERYAEAFIKICELFADKNITQTNLSKGMTTFEGSYNAVFTSGRSLFLVEVIGELCNMRSMNENFGVVVMPKFDEASDYISPVFYGAMGVCVPVTSDAERTSTVLEAMAKTSYELVRPAYYDVMLGSKLVRDEKSTDSLDVILKNGSFDISYVYNWGNIRTLLETNAYKNKQDVASLVESKAAAIRKDIEVSVKS